MRWLVVVLVVSLSGCFGTGSDDRQDPTASVDWPRCEHPWPCGDGREFTAGETPADGWPLRERVQVKAALDTGVTLDGAVWWPDVPEDEDVPIVLWATPYAGQCRYSRMTSGTVSVGDPVGAYCDDAPYSSGLGNYLYNQLGAQGYAMAMFNVRGTGLSSGCYDYYGSESQRDLAALVEFLAELPGSNGRVGMWGISAMGTTPWMAAIHAPPSLKAIAPSGIISDLYLNRFTPQGAGTTEDTFALMWSTQNSVVPAGGTLGRVNVPEEQTFAQNQMERGCANALDSASTALRLKYSDDGAHEWWEDRRLVKDFGKIEAAVMVHQGQWEGGHRYQEDAIWDRIHAPKWFLFGPWGHDFPIDEEHLATYPYANTSWDLYTAWFDFWLKGIDDPPRMNVVDSIDRDGQLDVLDAWPPLTTTRALYLGAGGATDAPTSAMSFRSSPDQGADVCAAGQGTIPSIKIESEPLIEPIHIMGNPMALLELSSDLPGGQIILDVYAIGPGTECSDDPAITEIFVSDAGANLRHYDGVGDGQPFPTNTPTNVRLDLMSVSKRIDAGSRIVVVLSGTGAREYEDPQYTPTLTIGPGSHILLPLASGNLGTDPPAMEYEPRPRLD